MLSMRLGEVWQHTITTCMVRGWTAVKMYVEMRGCVGAISTCLRIKARRSRTRGNLPRKDQARASRQHVGVVPAPHGSGALSIPARPPARPALPVPNQTSPQAWQPRTWSALHLHCRQFECVVLTVRRLFTVCGVTRGKWTRDI